MSQSSFGDWINDMFGAVGITQDTASPSSSSSYMAPSEVELNHRMSQASTNAVTNQHAPMTIYETIAASPDHTLLKALIDLVGLQHFTECQGPHTVFAPTNCAFRDLTLGQIVRGVQTFICHGKEATIELLSHILRNHIVGGCHPAKEVVHGARFHAESGHNLCVFTYKPTCGANKGCASTYINLEDRDFRRAARITKVNIQACDGVIHVIDELILEGKDHPRRSVYDIIASSPVHKILAGLVCKAGLRDTLQDLCEEMTVFAPTDAAFALIPKCALDKLLASPEALKAVLLAHVVPGLRISTHNAELKHDYPTADSSTLQLRTCDKALYVAANGADLRTPKNLPRVVKADLIAENGIVHAIDHVISVTKLNLVQVLQKAGNFTCLLKAVQAAGLVSALEDCSGRLTVFAPTDEAFAWLHQHKMFTDDLMADTQKLKKFIMHHVIVGRYYYQDLPLNHPIPTLDPDQQIVVEEHHGRCQVHLHGSEAKPSHIVAHGFVARNGIAHAIDRPLLTFCLESYKERMYHQMSRTPTAPRQPTWQRSNLSCSPPKPKPSSDCFPEQPHVKSSCGRSDDHHYRKPHCNLDRIETEVKQYMVRSRSPAPASPPSRSRSPSPVTLKLRSRSPSPASGRPQVREFERRTVTMSPDGRRETFTDIKGTVVFETDSNGVRRQIYEDEHGMVTYVANGRVVSQEEFDEHDVL